MFSRAAGAPLIGGNHVDLLEDGRENYAAWLEAIRSAKHLVHFENYFLRDDEVGREFAAAFMAAARRGARVRILCDWMGGFGVRFQRALRGTLHLARTNAFFLGGGKALMNAYYAAAERLGIDVVYDAEVVGLDVVDGTFREATLVIGGESRTVRAALRALP